MALVEPDSVWHPVGMRTLWLPLALCLTFTPASAAEITSAYAAPCANVATLQRMDAIGRTGDRDGLVAFINTTLASGECHKLAKGSPVRVERTEGTYACVAPLGTAAACQWVYAREVSR